MYLTLRLTEADIRNHVCDIRGLVSDPFHIGDHFQCRRDFPEIRSKGTLQKKQAHTDIFNLTLLLVDLAVYRIYLLHLVLFISQECSGRQCDRLLAQASHFNQFHMHFFKLLVEFGLHHPNLPVI